MARRLIVDTGVLIESERSKTSLSSVISVEDDLVISALTVAELRTGIELASDHHRSQRAEFVDRVLNAMPVEPYDLATAEAHSRLLAHVHRAGRKRGAHDLIIAATAIATRRIILTTDRHASFGDLPGVDCLLAG